MDVGGDGALPPVIAMATGLQAAVLYRRLVAQQGSEGILDLAATLHGPVFGPLAALTPHTASAPTVTERTPPVPCQGFLRSYLEPRQNAEITGLRSRYGNFPHARGWYPER